MVIRRQFRVISLGLLSGSSHTLKGWNAKVAHIQKEVLHGHFLHRLSGLFGIVLKHFQI
jgi:hypothetical protein